MTLFQRFANWVRSDYPGPKGPHIALLALFPWTQTQNWGFIENPSMILEMVRDDDESVWIGWHGQDRGQWMRLK